jgi:hypothetical protein
MRNAYSKNYSHLSLVLVGENGQKEVKMPN